MQRSSIRIAEYERRQGESWYRRWFRLTGHMPPIAIMKHNKNYSNLKARQYGKTTIEKLRRMSIAPMIDLSIAEIRLRHTYRQEGLTNASIHNVRNIINEMRPRAEIPDPYHGIVI